MSDTFRAIRFHDYGGPDKLVLENLPRPALAPDEVLVEVAYAGVNPIDWKLRSGYLKAFMPLPLPFTPGIDLSGTVAELGSAVKGLSKGQAVFGVGSGSYAEFAVAKAADLVPLPDGLGLDLAATVPVAALTAWKALEDGGVAAGKTVAILGAAGGVGAFAVQLAKAKGAKVIAVASSANAGYVKSLGADAVVDYAAGSLSASIVDVDLALDLVGGPTLESAYALVKKGGKLVTVAGQVSEEKAKAAGIAALSSGRGPAELLKPIAEMLAKKSLRAEAGKVFPLAEAKAAQELSQTGHGRGRILLKAKG